MVKKRIAKPRVNKSKEINAIDDNLVLSYLQDNPNFFMRNANSVDTIQVPHGIHGTVSLVEWQLKRQRERINQLEEEITALFETATQNEYLFNQLLNLILSLSLAQTLDDFTKRLNSWTRKLGLSYVEIRLFTDSWNVSPPFEKTEWGIDRERFESMRINRLSHSKHFLGQLNPTELSIVLTSRVLVGSVALTLMQCNDTDEEQRHKEQVNINEKKNASGIVLFVSPNESHFKQGLDTALLDKLSELLPKFLSKWITVKI